MKKSFIFKKSFNEIFTKERLSFEIKRSGVEVDIDNFFDFAPHKTFLLPKDNGEFREISISDDKSKIIQRILVDELSSILKFSDRNYAYQKNKSPLKAINRVKHIIKEFEFIIKVDIEKFFDKIDQEILISKLEKIIKDKKIIYLIIIFLKNGTLFKNEWIDKLEGVYQGDVLSPLLSNIYLHNFDTSLTRNEIEFVRYADDIILFADSFNEANKILEFVENRLKTDKLSLNKNKTLITHKMKGFEFLGVKFNELEGIYSIDNERLMNKVSKISNETKNLNLVNTITKLNQHIMGFKLYYSKIINNSKQLEVLQNREDEIIIKKIIEAKKSREIRNKSQFLNYLEDLESYIEIENYGIKILSDAYENMKISNYKKEATKKVEGFKREFLKNNLKYTELIISQTGSYLTFFRNKIKIKNRNEETKEIPFHKVKRIIITNKMSSISTYLIYKCAEHQIDIDFIDSNSPYALLTYNKNITKELHIKQLEIVSSKIGLNYAKNLYIAKGKNQLNLVKYFNIRRNSETLQKRIEEISRLISKIEEVKDLKSLMGLEGEIGNLYWRCFGEIINLKGFNRTHKDSTDAINQALNYGYGILYNRIQSDLIRNGLNIYYSFMHTINYRKPTLVYDFIEPFRTPVVDREIISIINKNQNLKLNKENKLDEKSKKIVIQHIQERLSTLTKTKYGKTTYLNLISFEVNSLKLDIEKVSENHKFFINKY